MSTARPSSRRGPWRLLLGLVVGGGGAYGAWRLLGTEERASETVPTWMVARGPLRITVTEGGSLQSVKSSVISSQVEGSTKIVGIVPEGTVITPEDVTAARVLVELDSSDIRTKLNRQEISVSDAAAALAQSQGALSIQRNQNESDLRKAELEVRFARLDLDKYLGATVAARVVASKDAAGRRVLPEVKGLADDPALEGEALQETRRLKSEIDLATEEVSRAKDKLAGTEKLLAKGYVSQDELVADRLALKRQEVALEQANTALALALAYELPKQVERLWSDLLEAEEALGRTRKQADSALAQAEADLRGREEKLRLERDQLETLNRQLAACVIRATTPGLVVYASSEDKGDWRDSAPIQAGTAVREREAILSIPDPKRMGVRVNVHETALDKVRKGQTCAVTIDAFPGRAFAGRIEKLATLPNAANRWQNPDLKLYATEVVLEDPPATLRPGMSARVEILVQEIESTLAVPVQAIVYAGGRSAVHVRGPDGRFAARGVRLGAGSDRMSEVLEGLAEGDVVLLAPPKDTGTGRGAPAGPDARDGTGKGGPQGDRPARRDRGEGAGPSMDTTTPAPGTIPPSAPVPGAAPRVGATPAAAGPGRDAR